MLWFFLTQRWGEHAPECQGQNQKEEGSEWPGIWKPGWGQIDPEQNKIQGVNMVRNQGVNIKQNDGVRLIWNLHHNPIQVICEQVITCSNILQGYFRGICSIRRSVRLI